MIPIIQEIKNKIDWSVWILLEIPKDIKAFTLLLQNKSHFNLQILKDFAQISHDKDLLRIIFQATHNINIEMALAQNQYCPPDVLLSLCMGSFGVRIKSAVAANYNADERILSILSENKSPTVRTAVANNIRTPKHILGKLSNDSASEVKVAVAHNKSTPQHVLHVLSKSKIQDVVYWVVNNQSVAAQTLIELQNHPNDIIRAQVARFTKDKDTLDNLANNKESLVKEKVADNKHCSPKTLRKLFLEIVNSGQLETYIINNIAMNPRTDKNTLDEIISVYSDPDTCFSIITNPSVSLTTLYKLLDHESSYVRTAAREKIEQRANNVRPTI